MEELPEDISLAKDTVQGILKAKKLLKMYLPNNPMYIKTSEEIYNKFKNFFELNNELSLKIRQNEIIFNNEQIYYNSQKDDNLALFFFKDGIRDITFLKGFSQKELEDFIKILNTDFETVALDDDIVTLLWERNFEHIKYIVDEAILSDEEDYERDKLYEEIENKTYSDDDLTRAYHDGLKTAEKQASIMVPISETEFKHIAKEIEKEKIHPKIDKSITILLELLYQTKGKTLFSEVVDFIKNAIVYCIKSGDFKRASFIINSIKPIIEDNSLGEESIKILKRIFSAINSEPFIREIGRIIDSEAIIEDDELIAFVKHLDKTSIPFFIQLVGELRSIKGRRLVIDAISIVGRLDIKTLAKGLSDSRWYVVRNIISILGKIADARAVGYLTKILSHPDQRVRKEAIKTICGIGGSNMLPYLTNALNDSVPSIRITAVRMLGNTRTEAVKKLLLTELSKKDFSSKDFAEKKEFYEAITHWQDQEVKDFLLATLKKKKFWGRIKNDETRTCAAYAIGIVGDKDAIPFLEEAQSSKNKLLKTFSTVAIKRLTT